MQQSLGQSLGAMVVVHLCRGIYHKTKVGDKNGPTKEQLDDLLETLENGCICGNAVGDIGGFYVRRYVTLLWLLD